MCGKKVNKGFFVLFLFLFMPVYNGLSQMIYTVYNREEADVVVFVVESEASCDLRVFFVEEFSQTGKPGVWAGTFEKDKAQINVYFTFDESEAQLKIYVTDEESKAGWVNEEKRNLIKV